MNANRRTAQVTMISEQCARWDCFIHPWPSTSDYCHQGCLRMATDASTLKRPILMPTPFGPAYDYFVAKIFHVLKTKRETGVPHFSEDLFKIPPWKSNMFSLRHRVMQDNWLFIGSSQIPITLDFKWIEVGSTMISEVWNGAHSEIINEVKHCVFKPFSKQDNKWELHQFSSLDLVEKAVYVMHCSEFTKPLRKKKSLQKKRKIDTPLSDTSKKTSKKTVRKRKWPQKDRLIEEPLSAEHEQTDCFIRLYSEMESLERAAALFASAPQSVDKKNVFASVSEEIRRQMENVKSHILTNGGKLNNLAKDTRGHAETSLRGLEANHIKVKVEDEGIHKFDRFARLHSETGSFERAVALFSLVRQNIEKKLKSGAEMKNSSDILGCVAKEMHIEMENIKSHILTNGNHIKVKLERDV